MLPLRVAPARGKSNKVLFNNEAKFSDLFWANISYVQTSTGANKKKIYAKKTMEHNGLFIFQEIQIAVFCRG